MICKPPKDALVIAAGLATFVAFPVAAGSALAAVAAVGVSLIAKKALGD